MCTTSRTVMVSWLLIPRSNDVRASFVMISRELNPVTNSGPSKLHVGCGRESDILHWGTGCLASYQWLHAMQHTEIAWHKCLAPNQWLHARPQHRVAYRWYTSPQINGCTHDGSIAWRMDGCLASIQWLHARRRHCVAHGASHRIMCCRPCSIAWH